MTRRWLVEGGGCECVLVCVLVFELCCCCCGGVAVIVGLLLLLLLSSSIGVPSSGVDPSGSHCHGDSRVSVRGACGDAARPLGDDPTATTLRLTAIRFRSERKEKKKRERLAQ
jgi:hypothetical protein